MNPYEPVVASLKALGSVVVAFSGGADSAYLAWAARQILGAQAVLAVTADSPSLASGELDHCRVLAQSWDLPWMAVRTDEMENPEYVANAGDRCYWCKAALMDVVAPVAQQRGATVILGVNLDDLADHRPGQSAARARGARFPLVEAALTKADVRSLSLAAGLPTWDRPAAACLASRLPYGTPVTLKSLTAVDRAESALHRMGFAELRVRHYGDLARIEVPDAQLDQVVHRRVEVVQAMHRAGYRYVTLDLEGFRSGNLNDALDA